MSGDAQPTGDPTEQAETAKRPTVQNLLAQAERLKEAIDKHQEQLGGRPE
ncbi:hypothetical protein AB0C11_44720 [Streptomyces sp. NPDC039016]